MSVRALLSVDLPWSSDGWVGVAVASLDDRGTRVSVGVVPSRREPLPGGLVESGDFIDFGARADARLTIDASPPDPKLTAGARRAYLESLHGALCDLARLPGWSPVDAAAIDVPLVPPCLTRGLVIEHGVLSKRRPVERAFEKKVRFAGPGWAFDFANPQSGICVGWRPGYAAAELVEHVWGARAIAESFPQLSIGALQEMPDAAGPRMESLAGHKGAPNRSRAGREAVYARLRAWLGAEPEWMSGGLHLPGAADALDALLGLLPLIALHTAWEPSEAFDVRPAHRRAVLLRNLPEGKIALPIKQGPKGNKLVTGCRAWIDVAPVMAPGVNDDGILALDLAGWC